jgi:hypothetical protein
VSRPVRAVPGPLRAARPLAATVHPLAAALLLAAAGCGSSLPPSAMARPVGEDLVDLLPSGADALVDIDVAQLDGWPTTRHLLALLPPEGQAQLARLGDDPLAKLEAVAVGVYQAGGAAARATIVVRGTLDWEHIRGLVGGTPGEYHGAPLSDGPDGAVARVAPTVLAFGTAAMVRRVLDVAHHEDESVRAAALDKPLRTALAHAPTAKLGRPAIMAALVLTDGVRGQLRAADWRSAADLDWLALSFAVGSGFDVGVVAGGRGAGEARTLAETMKKRAGEYKTQTTVRLLGLTPYIDPFIVVAKDAEVHVAYRLSEARVDQLVTRLTQMQSLMGSGRGRGTETRTKP